MTIPNSEILQACLPILEQARIHPHGTNERCFLTAYQIWLILNEENDPICGRLTDEYGEAVGRHGGANVGPAQRIAQALGRSDRIETRYLDTQRINFQDQENFSASGNDCGLFRLRD